jgi:hypothetical protein
VHGKRRNDLVALAHGGKQDVLVMVDLENGRVSRRLPLPRGIDFRAVDRTPSGLVVIGGNAPSGKKTLDDVDAQTAFLAIVDPGLRRLRLKKLRSVETPHERFGYPDWQIADVGVAADDSFAVVTYHGVNTTGADVIPLGDGEAISCTPTTSVTAGCIEVIHGAVEMLASGFIAALGTPPQIGRFDARGKSRARWNVGLPDAHVTEFALYQNSAIVLERCAKGGGMAEVRISDGRVQILHRAAVSPAATLIPPNAVCGERISAGRNLIVVAKRGLPRGPLALMFLERNGRVAKQVALAVAPLDVLVLR